MKSARLVRRGMLGVGLALLAPATALGATLQTKLLAATGESGAPAEGMVRTADGRLHVVFATKVAWSNAADGIAATSISPSGKLGSQVQALSGWNTGIPGLMATPSGALEAVFGGGADDGSTGSYSGPWGIVSNDGGVTWSQPADVGSHSGEAFAGDTTVQLASGNPVLTLPQAGTLVIQSGFGTGAPTFQLDTPANVDGFVGNVDAAVDAATGQLVASWSSAASPGGLWFQSVAPSIGSPQKVPGPVTVGERQQLVVAARDAGPGVFAAYPADAAAKHVRLLRYGGGSVAVGSVKGLRAAALGVATGIGGRIWVMWAGPSAGGHDQVAITRSNKAVTRFEPIQHLSWSPEYLFRIFGDGRLGPLDMLINEVPSGQKLINGIYYARILPELSATVSVSKAANAKFKLKVKVTDAGDAVSGAKVAAGGKSATTNGQGAASLTVGGVPGQHIKLTVAHSGYRSLTKHAKL